MLLCVPVGASLESGLSLAGGSGSFALQSSAAGLGSIPVCHPLGIRPIPGYRWCWERLRAAAAAAGRVAAVDAAEMARRKCGFSKS